jgi:hypothetical protein
LLPEILLGDVKGANQRRGRYCSSDVDQRFVFTIETKFEMDERKVRVSRFKADGR